MHKKLFLFVVLLLLFTVKTFAYKQPLDKYGVTEIQASILVLDLENIDSGKMTFQANILFLYEWQDNSLIHSGKFNINKKLEDIWHPSFQIVNMQKAINTFDDKAEITPKGKVYYVQRIFGTFSQPLYLSRFPFDKHFLNLTIVPEGYSGCENIKLIQNPNKESGVAKVLSIPDWSVLNFSTKAAYYQPFPKYGKVPSLTFSLEVERHYGYYIVKIVLPLILIFFMSWVVFWLEPKELKAQLAVSVTSMLTLIAYRFTIGGILPRISYLTNLDFLVLGSTILVFASLMEVIYAVHLAKSDKLKKAISLNRFCRWFFPLIFLMLILMSIFC